MPKRICIFVHCSTSNALAPSVLLYLQELAQHCSEILFVSNSELTLELQAKVKPLVAEILQRENIGMDFGAWKHAIERVGWGCLEEFDELILANDSCYAPMFPFDEMFNVMSVAGNDFWGVTEHPAGVTRSGDLEAHLQSYFLVFNKGVVSSEVFRGFWDAVSVEGSDYNEIIGNYESKLTPMLNRAGFNYKAYIGYSDDPSCTGGNWSNPLYVNRTIWNWSTLLQQKSPFLKKKAITFHLERVVRLIRSGYGSKVTAATHRHTFFWKECIKQSKTLYPVDVIYNEVRASHGKVPVESARLSERLLFAICAPLRFYRRLKRNLSSR